MFAGEHAVAAAEEAQGPLRTAKREMIYEQEVNGIDTVLLSEDQRRLRVRLLLAEHDRDDFRSQLEGATAELEDADVMRSAAEVQLNEIQNDMALLQGTLRARLRDIERLTAEAESHIMASQDSTKIRAENLALSREIAILRPEIDHLRSLSASHESVVSEKLALEKQVIALEVDLQTTKQALDRLRLKNNQQTDAENGAALRLEQLNKQYLLEKDERERIEKEAFENVEHCKVLESKLSKLEAKLEVATAQLQQAQDRLHNQLESRVSAQQVPIVNEEPASPNRSMRFDPNMTIATPGDVKPKKKPQRTSALPGVKSSFSITPFLNRTSRGSIDEDFISDEESDFLEQEIIHQRPKNNEKPSRGRPRKATGTKARAKVKTTSSSTHGADASMGSDPSHSPKQSNDNVDERSLLHADEAESRPRTTKEKVGRKRKLAIGGKRDRSLFDNDNDDFGVIRKTKIAQSRSTQGRQSEALRPVRRLGANTTLDTGFSFSPLKRKARAI